MLSFGFSRINFFSIYVILEYMCENRFSTHGEISFDWMLNKKQRKNYSSILNIEGLNWRKFSGNYIYFINIPVKSFKSIWEVSQLMVAPFEDMHARFNLLSWEPSYS